MDAEQPSSTKRTSRLQPQRADHWTTQEFVRAGRGVIRQPQGKLFAAGNIGDTKPTASVDFLGAFLTDEAGAWVCQSDGLGGYEWKLLGETILFPDPALTLLAVETFTGVASLTKDGIFTSTYRNYRVAIEITELSIGSSLLFKLRAAGVSSTTGYDYDNLIHESSDNTGNAYSIRGSNAGNWELLSYGINATTDRAFLVMELNAPQAAARTLCVSNGVSFYSTTLVASSVDHGGHRTASAYDGFILTPSGGGTFGGTVKIFGWQDTVGTVGGGGVVYTDEMARDAIGTALVAGANTTITVNDAGNTITIGETTAATGGSVPDVLMLGGM